MKSISDTTACFVDHGGLYLPLAKKLSESYKRIIYHDPCEEAFPTVNRAIIGDSMPSDPRIEVTDDFWQFKNDIDLYIMPDSRGEGLQAELRSQGKPVWGSNRSSSMEHSRGKFLKILEDLGFEIPPWEKIVGIEELRNHLRDKEDKYIKISKYRGSLETKHWRSFDDDEAWLDFMAVKLGGVKNLIPFYVFDAIKTDLELGADTYCIRGQFPKLLLDAYEWKDCGYFGTIKPRDEMPEQTKEVLAAFAPLLGDADHANFWSMEIRVKGEHYYFLDPTPRGPIPGTGSQMELYSNLAEIIAGGAEGELVEPMPIAKFVAECVLSVKTKSPMWSSVRMPEELEQWAKLSGCCMVNGRAWFPSDDHEEVIGWLVAIGDTPKEVVDTMLEHVKLLPDGVTAATESLIDLIKEIDSAEEKGIEFSDEEMPAPESVITNGD